MGEVLDFKTTARKAAQRSARKRSGNAVASSVIRAIDYDEATRELDVTFTSGKIYRYFAVPLAVYAAFMDASSKDARYQEWSKKFADGSPMTTEHYGFAKYFEGCLNSPVRDVIRSLVREVLTEYPVDVMYFDGPYQGMMNAREPCQGKYCQAAYQKRFGKPVPTKQDDVAYVEWMANDVVIAFLHEIREMIRAMVEQEGRTVFVSSHLLDEVERTCDAAAIVDRGKVVSQGPIAELAGGDGAAHELIIGVQDVPLAM